MDAQSTTIGEATYEVRMLDPLIASRLFIKLAKVMAPGLGAVGGAAMSDPGGLAKMLEAEGGEEDDPVFFEGDPKAFERGLVGIIDRISPDELEEIIRHMAGVTCVVMANGTKPELAAITVSNQFRGKLWEMYQWLAFALKVNFFPSSSFKMSQVMGLVSKAAV